MIAKPHSIVTERLSLFGHTTQVRWGGHRSTIREHASELHCCSSLASVCDLQSSNDLASLSFPSLLLGEGRGEGNSTARHLPTTLILTLFQRQRGLVWAFPLAPRPPRGKGTNRPAPP